MISIAAKTPVNIDNNTMKLIDDRSDHGSTKGMLSGRTLFWKEMDMIPALLEMFRARCGKIYVQHPEKAHSYMVVGDMHYLALKENLSKRAPRAISVPLSSNNFSAIDIVNGSSCIPLHGIYSFHGHNTQPAAHYGVYKK